MLRAVPLLLISFALILASHQAPAQTGADTYVNYFLDERPPAESLNQSSDIGVAKARVLQVARVDGRHGENYGSDTPYQAEIEVIDVLAGKAAIGDRLVVGFGSRGSGARHTHPLRADMRVRDYFIVFRPSGNPKYQLVGFPITQQAYNAWTDLLSKQMAREQELLNQKNKESVK